MSTGLSGVYFEDAIDLRAGGMLQIADADADAELSSIEDPQYCIEPWKPKPGSVANLTQAQ